MSAPVYLVRHGQSEWNLLRLTQGQIAHPRLTDQGREQARSAAVAIELDLEEREQRAVCVVSSDLARARETAEIIAAVLGVNVVPDIRLREQHLGDLEGKSYEETWAVAERHDWSDPSIPIAGGESLLAVRRRMVESLNALDRQSVHVLVSHGDAIRAAIAYFRDEPAHEASWIEVPNGAVARIDTAITWLTDRGLRPSSIPR